MIKFSYDFIVGSSNEDLKKKLIMLQAKTGYTYQIINIYPEGKKVVCWYYADRRDR